jgi:hypothetical protein
MKMSKSFRRRKTKYISVTIFPSWRKMQATKPSLAVLTQSTKVNGQNRSIWRA